MLPESQPKNLTTKKLKYLNITQQNELEIEIGDVWQEHETWVSRSRYADPVA